MAPRRVASISSTLGFRNTRRASRVAGSRFPGARREGEGVPSECRARLANQGPVAVTWEGMVRSILFVDDNPLDLELARVAFEESRSRVELLTEGDPLRVVERLLRLRSEGKAGPDVILIDLRMPKLDGFQLATRIREQIPDGGFRLVFFTTSRHPADERRAREMGVMVELKPSELDGYVSLLEKLEAVDVRSHRG